MKREGSCFMEHDSKITDGKKERNGRFVTQGVSLTKNTRTRAIIFILSKSEG